jgi:hypothetical protein
MHVITITTYPSMPWQFRVQGPGGSRGRMQGRDCSNAGEAAAVAINWASNVGRPYVIVGHDAALKLIPPEVRSKA